MQKPSASNRIDAKRAEFSTFALVKAQ